MDHDSWIRYRQTNKKAESTESIIIHQRGYCSILKPEFLHIRFQIIFLFQFCVKKTSSTQRDLIAGTCSYADNDMTPFVDHQASYPLVTFHIQEK